MKLKTIEYYENLNRQTASIIAPDGRSVVDIWADIAGPKIIGNMSKFYAQVKPNSIQSFYRSYIAKIGINKLFRVAELYCKKINLPEFNIETCFDLIIFHAIVQTIRGKKVEMWLQKKLQNYGFNAVITDGVWDTDFNVDIIAIKNNQVHAYIQVKPISYFCGRSPKLTETRCDAFKKEQNKNNAILHLRSQGKKGYTVKPTIYMAYDTNSVKFSGNEITSIKWASMNNNVKFHLDDLCFPNGSAKFHVKDFQLKDLNI